MKIGMKALRYDIGLEAILYIVFSMGVQNFRVTLVCDMYIAFIYLFIYLFQSERY